jgi:hypothetical protein
MWVVHEVELGGIGATSSSLELLVSGQSAVSVLTILLVAEFFLTESQK